MGGELAPDLVLVLPKGKLGAFGFAQRGLLVLRVPGKDGWRVAGALGRPSRWRPAALGTSIVEARALNERSSSEKRGGAHPAE